MFYIFNGGVANQKSKRSSNVRGEDQKVEALENKINIILDVKGVFYNLASAILSY